MSASANLVVERVGVESVGRFEPLWSELLAHHALVVPDHSTQSPGRSWELRRALYERLFALPGTFGLIAVAEGVDIGYAMVEIHDGPDDTWVTGSRIAEVESLCVASGARGDGVGTLMLDRVDEELEAIGVHDLQIAVIAANADALRFYERRGLRPRVTVLSRYGDGSR